MKNFDNDLVSKCIESNDKSIISNKIVFMRKF